MKDQKEIQIAWDIYNLVNELSKLLWDRYEEGFLEIYLREEDDKFLCTIGHSGLTKAQDKMEE